MENLNLSPNVTHQPSLLGGAENIKLLFDEELDNRRESLARARAWEAISLDMAQTASRRAQNAATFDHYTSMASATSAQTGQTENQQTVSPAGTATSEAIKRGVGVAAEQVAANIAALSDVVTKFADAMNAVLLTAAGGASTPSQTQPKPTGTTA